MSPVCSAHVSYDKRHVNTSVPIAFSAIHSIYITTECQKTYNTALYLILIRSKFVCRQPASVCGQRHHGRTARLVLAALKGCAPNKPPPSAPDAGLGLQRIRRSVGRLAGGKSS